MSLSLKKLERFLETHGYFAKSIFIENDLCVYLEIICITSSNTFFIYILPKYPLQKPDEEDFRYFEIETVFENDVQEEETCQQLKRIFPENNNSFFVMFHRDKIYFPDKIVKIKTEDHFSRVLNFCVDLDFFYKNIYTINEKLKIAENTLFQTMKENTKLFHILLTKTLSKYNNVSSIISSLDDKKRRYDTLFTRYRNIINRLLNSEKKLLSEKSSNEVLEKLKQINELKKGIIKDILEMKENRDSDILETDSLIYENMDMISQIFENLKKIKLSQN